MRTWGPLEITLPKVTQPEVTKDNPGIPIPADMHVPSSSLTLKDVITLPKDGPAPDVYPVY